MARTITAAERLAVASGRFAAFSKFEIEDPDGTWRDVSAALNGVDWLNQVQISSRIDDDTVRLTGNLLRDSSTLSLAPFRSDSLVNRNAGGSYAPMLDLWRRWRASTAIMPAGYAPSGTDWKEIAAGRIDDLDVSGDKPEITIAGRGEEAPLLDTFIDEEREYSGPMEDVLQQMLDDNGWSSITLVVDESPLYTMDTWTQQKGGLFEAMTEVAHLAGFMIRYRYNASNVNELLLFKPDREASSPVWTLGPDEYTRVTQNKMSLAGMRNFVKVTYADSTAGKSVVYSPTNSGTVSSTAGAATFSTSQAGVIVNGAVIVVHGRPGFYTVSAFNGTTGCTLSPADTFSPSGWGTSDSLTNYRKRADLEIDLSAKTQVTTATAAQGFADAVCADTQFPDLEQGFETFGFWFVQLHDYGQFLANRVHYDEDQFGGVTSIVQTLANGTVRTDLGASGKPKGRYTTWRRFARVSTQQIDIQKAIALFCRAKIQATTPTDVTFRVAVADPFPLSDISVSYVTAGTGSVSPSSPQTIALADVTNDIDTTGFVDVTVDRADFGTGTGRITFTATATDRTAGSDAGDVPSLDRDSQTISARVLRVSETADQIVVRVSAIAPNAGAIPVTVTVNYDAGGLSVSPATGGTFSASSDFAFSGHIDYTITRDTQGGTPRRVTFTVSCAGYVDGTDGVDVPPNSGRNQCQVYSTSAQSLSVSGNFFPINWNAEQYDDGGMHDNAVSNTRITIPSGGDKGVYYLSALIQFQSNATGGRTVRIVKNGSTILSEVILPPVSGDFTKVMVHGYEKNPTVGDYYEVHAKQASGGALNVGSNTGTINDGFFQAQQQLGG